MTASDLFQQGMIDDAVQAAITQVKKKPTDINARVFLSELLCFTGDLERADRQLDTIINQQPDLMFVLQFRQLIRAETSRREFINDGRLPSFLSDPPTYVQKLLEASIRLRENQIDEAMPFVEASLESTPTVNGHCDDCEFSGIRDLDDLLIGVCEVLTGTGEYYWIPFEAIGAIQLRPPKRPRDLLWRSAHFEIPGGPDGEVFIPALYVNSHLHSDDKVRIGRSTDWIGDDDKLMRGVGQRVFLIGDEDRAIMDLKNLKIKDVA